MRYLRDTLLANREKQNKAPTKATKPDDILDAVPTDDVPPFADQFSDSNTSLMAVSAVQQWAETDDLTEGEGYADRLLSLLVGVVDDDLDGELSDEEAEDLLELADAAAEYLESLGVSEDDISQLLNDWDNEAGERVQELVASKLEDGAEPTDFVFGDGSDEAALDAVYKKKLVVRKGKKVRINKRVSGTIRLSAAQKVAVAKMRRKSNTGMAKLRRAKSMRVRARAGLNKQ